MGSAITWTTGILVRNGRAKTRTTPLRRIDVTFARAIFGHDNCHHSTAIIYCASKRFTGFIGRIKKHAHKLVT
jgi:hypothetical protein